MQSYPNKYLDICLYVLKVSMEKKKKKMTLGFLLIIFIFENDPRMVERVYLKEPDCESMWLHFKVKRHINFHCNLKQKRNSATILLYTYIETWGDRRKKVRGALMLLQSLPSLKASASTKGCCPGCHRY